MRRSMLFLPGNSPKMLLNGETLGADSVIFDLEDAVAPDEKDAARILVRNVLKALPYSDSEIIVRINDLSTPFWQDDLKEMVPLCPSVILPTKVSNGADIRTLDRFITEEEMKNGIVPGTIKLMPLIETAIGVENAFEIAEASPRLCALYLGAEDLSASLHCKRSKEGNEIFYSRCRLVCAARAAGIEVYDTPFTAVEDLEGLAKDALFAKSLGFTGKAVINPRHIAVVNRVFSPTDADIQYAEEVLAAYEEGKKSGKGAVSLRGKMIDAPIVLRAHQTLEMAGKLKGGAAK